jgi:hypothetical protein
MRQRRKVSCSRPMRRSLVRLRRARENSERAEEKSLRAAFLSHRSGQAATSVDRSHASASRVHAKERPRAIGDCSPTNTKGTCAGRSPRRRGRGPVGRSAERHTCERRRQRGVHPQAHGRRQVRRGARRAPLLALRRLTLRHDLEPHRRSQENCRTVRRRRHSRALSASSVPRDAFAHRGERARVAGVSVSIETRAACRRHATEHFLRTTALVAL